MSKVGDSNAVSFPRRLALRELTRNQILYHLRTPEEALFKEVWEQCDGRDELAVVDGEIQRIVSAIEEL